MLNILGLRQDLVFPITTCLENIKRLLAKGTAAVCSRERQQWEITSVKDGERCKKERRGEEEERLDYRDCSVTFDKLEILTLHVML